jgi:hypothetical protein
VASVRYQLTSGEAVGTAFRRRMLGAPRLALNAFMLVVGVALVLAVPEGRIVGVALIVFVVATPILFYFAIARVISGTPWLTAPTTLEFDDAGVRLAAGDAHLALPWSAFRAWSRGREHIFLLFGRTGAALTVPLRAFDGATLEEFTRHLERIGTPR